MITRAQALALGDGKIHEDIHCEVVRSCRIVIGPRGGRTDKIVRCRVSGRCQTWKTRPNEFRLPVKHGMYESSAITHRNAEQFHVASECPARKQELENKATAEHSQSVRESAQQPTGN